MRLRRCRGPAGLKAASVRCAGQLEPADPLAPFLFGASGLMVALLLSMLTLFGFGALGDPLDLSRCLHLMLCMVGRITGRFLDQGSLPNP
ncbi:hypothetical protein GCM10022419_133840 [Nonomuraea rosea]|uniref:Uncharacterized protein n=1 Tax=Nonomuraea rosea TaxID=638574 RepID=A0ABP7A5W7_9ACTN